jgi:uncharacterized SAM-binding protein YcdF (DUF218 family)
MKPGPTTGSYRQVGPFRSPRGLLRRLGEAMMAILLLAAIALVIDFSRFVSLIEAREPSFNPAADGMVALTGGAERITDALDLLATGRAKRLLITGVNMATSEERLVQAAPRYQDLFSCCVDLDRNALNTLGNAMETARWARANGFTSLIIVTSSYHMPRAMLELSRLAPQLALTPHPVVADGLHLDRWWGDSQTARVIVGEYFKYVIARARLRFDNATADPVSEAALLDTPPKR